MITGQVSVDAAEFKATRDALAALADDFERLWNTAVEEKLGFAPGTIQCPSLLAARTALNWWAPGTAPLPIQEGSRP